MATLLPLALVAGLLAPDAPAPWPAQADGDGQTVTGTDGADALQGTEGGDVIEGGAGADGIDGGGGPDWILGGPGPDRIEGGAGTDTASHADLEGPVAVDLAAGTAVSGGDRDRLAGVENATGTSHDDALVGDGGDNVLRGLAGRDSIAGGGGNDRIAGGGSDDRIDGGAGFDAAVFEGARADYEIVAEGASTVVRRLGEGNEGADTLTGVEQLVFSDGPMMLL